MTEVGKNVTEEKLFPGGRMVMTYYRGAFDPGFRKTFYVVLPSSPRPPVRERIPGGDSAQAGRRDGPFGGGRAVRI